ncbi:uncharacterized protein LOC100214485 isoform X1 [Hydra vulgaris]|uniref:uncharacterized protein LOC100214485 isoform X1 n=2 Tax=Hydra vulgaris TaxID=6087 RepID=UPI001F5E475A|nr:zinc/cadmium resistance protein isoform X1 [Hydra vulgaris]
MKEVSWFTNSQGTKMKCKFGRNATFILMLVITMSFFIVELVVGYMTKSMALVADSFQMLSDTVSIIVGFVAFHCSKRSETSSRFTYGWVRAEILGALVNSVFLAALCFTILIESFKRFAIPERVENPKLVLIVGAVGLLVNIIGLFLFNHHSNGHSNNSESVEKGHNNEVVDNIVAEFPLVDSSEVVIYDSDKSNSQVPQVVSNNENNKKKLGASRLNIRGVYLNILGDALGSVIVVISALIIMFVKADWTNYVDPAMSIISVSIILASSFSLLKESIMILMQTSPKSIKQKDIEEHILQKIPSVIGIKKFHVWQLTGDKIVASIHVTCNASVDYMFISSQIKDLLHKKGIHSSTIQLEHKKNLDSLAYQVKSNEALCLSNEINTENKLVLVNESVVCDMESSVLHISNMS